MDIPGLPQIPTDNLYKFVSLSGVLMILVGFAVPAFVRYRGMEADLELIARYKARSAEQARALEQLSSSIKIIEQSSLKALQNREAHAREEIAQENELLARLNNPNSRTPRVSTRIAANESIADSSKKAEALADSAHAVFNSVARADLETFERAVEAQRHFFRYFAWGGFGLAVVGSLLAAWGFRNWYFRLQKPLDEIVRLDAHGRRDRR